MAKRWVSLLGTVLTGRVPPFGAQPDPELPVEFERSDGGFYARWDEDGTPFYSSRAFLTGNPQALAGLAGLAVRGIRWTLSVRMVAGLRPGGSQFIVGDRFGDADVPRLRFVTAGVPVDLDGRGMPYILGEQVPMPFSTAASGSQWFNVPEGWLFSYNGVYTVGNAGSGSAYAAPTEAGYAMVASRSFEQSWPLPVGLVRGEPAEPLWTLWPGGVVHFDSATEDSRAAEPVSAVFSRLDLLVSEKPTWEIETDTSLARVGEEHTITGRIYYPDEGDGIPGMPLRFQSQSARVQLRRHDSPQWLEEVEATTDDNGDFQLFFRGMDAGDAVVIFGLVREDGVDRSRLYSPRFTDKGLPLLFFDDVSPPEPDPGTGETCITIPAVPAVPSIPARIEYIPTFRWDAGANSEVEQTGDCYARWTMPHAPVGSVCGFASARGDVADINRITHGIIFSQDAQGEGRYDIIESGVTLGVQRAYTSETVFELRRIGSSVVYLVDAAVLHDSTAPLEGPVLVSTSLYASGDSMPGGTGGPAPPPPPPPDPDEAINDFVYMGNVPPTAISDVYLLAAGDWTFTESAEGSSCDWQVVDATTQALLADGIEGGTASHTLSTPTAVIVGVSAFESGGPFRISGSATPPDPDPGEEWTFAGTLPAGESMAAEVFSLPAGTYSGEELLGTPGLLWIIIDASMQGAPIVMAVAGEAASFVLYEPQDVAVAVGAEMPLPDDASFDLRVVRVGDPPAPGWEPYYPQGGWDGTGAATISVDGPNVTVEMPDSSSRGHLILPSLAGTGVYARITVHALTASPGAPDAYGLRWETPGGGWATQPNTSGDNEAFAPTELVVHANSTYTSSWVGCYTDRGSVTITFSIEVWVGGGVPPELEEP